MTKTGLLDVTDVISLPPLDFRLPQHRATYTQARARCRTHSGFVLSNGGWGLRYLRDYEGTNGGQSGVVVLDCVQVATGLAGYLGSGAPSLVSAYFSR